MKTPCFTCNELTPRYDMISYGSPEQGYRDICTRCHNMQLARAAGIADFEYPSFLPFAIPDADGIHHQFHFRARLIDSGQIVLDAFELRRGVPGGYQFQVIGPYEDVQSALHDQLIKKIRRALAINHLEEGSHGLEIARPHVVRGRIDWNAAEDRIPILVIDGREITWQEFGRMLMTYEGWQFKLEIRDPSEEV